jgi:hypothetical protein
MTTVTMQTHAAEVTVALGDSTRTAPAEAPRCGGVGPSSHRHRHRLMCNPHSAAKHLSKPLRSPIGVTAYRHSPLTVSDLTCAQHNRVTRYS